MGKLVILVPNYSARITDISVGSTSILVGVEAHKIPISKLLCKAYVDTAEPPQIESHLDAESWAIPLTGRPQQWHIALFSLDSGELLDYRSHFGSPSAPGFSPDALDDERLRVIIAGGENESIEFKVLPGKDPERRSLIESVAAFANSSGGLVLVGVTDGGEVVGVFDDKAEEALSSLIADRTEPPIGCVIREVTVDDKRVLVVSVPASNSRPHLVRTGPTGGVPFVRRGSTDRAPSRYELDEMYRG